MNQEKFTVKAQEVLQAAQQSALAKDNPNLETAHLLKALLREDKEVTPFLLKKQQANPEQLEKKADEIISTFAKTGGSLHIAQDAAKALAKAKQHAEETGD
jgi:ATP-dependent Clp protease ATP-binding subunit ClpB